MATISVSAGVPPPVGEVLAFPQMPPISRDLAGTFGAIDIYVFDQLLKGRFDSARRVLDAGCGDGRNLHYLLASGRESFTPDGSYATEPFPVDLMDIYM